MDTVFFRLSIPACLRDLDADAELYWQRVDSDNQRLASGTVRLSDAHQLAAQHRCVLFIPVTDVYLARLELKTSNKKQLYKAVPYALEDELSEDIEQLHFAVHTNHQVEYTSVMVINRELLTELMSLLEQCQLMPEIITADIYDLVWSDSSSWSCLIENDYALVRTALDDGFSSSVSDLAEYIELTVKQTQSPPDKLQIYSSADTTELASEIVETSGIEVNLQTTLPIQQHFEQTHINLLQKDFAQEKTHLNSLKPWFTALLLTASIAVLLLTSRAIEVVRLNALDKRLNHTIEETFRETFPEVKNIVNPRVQMEQRLANIETQNQHKQRSLFLKLLHHSAEAIKAHTDSSITDIQFRASKLTLDINVPTIQVLEELKVTMQSKKINAQIQTARNVDKHVEARISIEE